MKFSDTIPPLPNASAQHATPRFEVLMEAFPALADYLSRAEHVKGLIQFVCANSPYLATLMERKQAWLLTILGHGFDAAYAMWRHECAELDPKHTDTALLMRQLREAKARLALLISLADITSAWSLQQVTTALSDVAAWAVEMCCQHLLWQGHTRGEIRLSDPAHPTRGSGLIVYGMGKLGGRELNYSSDIDLIVFYEKHALEYTGRHDIQRFFSKLTQEMARMMQERTADGYVFRTDLRLRPDPSSTPHAISTAGAMTYYETVGQNWERAAMIKARAIAGDIEAGERFLNELRPFIWRKFLDYAAIDDILSIKRQMHARAGYEPELAGHNLKTGWGGIREIEFFAQVHQLIWGGRLPSLRVRATCDALRAMVDADLLDAATCADLIRCYEHFRRVEHRLQMIADEQTHRLPETPEGLARMAEFCLSPSLSEFSACLLRDMQLVHHNFADAFSEKQQLSGDQGNLVFTGVDPDEETLRSIAAMGFRDTVRVWETIAAWHRGSRRATRTKRARELITEITPALLKAVGASADPDQAFLRLDDFVSRLPAVVQLFSLLVAQPHMIDLLAKLLGGAPAMAEILSRQPSLFDVLLSGDVYARTEDANRTWLDAMLSHARNADEQWQQLAHYRQEQEFWLAMQVLRRSLAPLDALPQLTRTAEICLSHLVRLVQDEFERDYGTIPGGQFAVVALGRLGAGEVCFGSDLDLVFVYDMPDVEAKSTGARTFDARVYYNRFAQRLVGLLQAMGPYGRLYQVDTRLRPSGHDGHLAVSFQGLQDYMRTQAWSFEAMAFSRGRAVAGDSDLVQALDAWIIAMLAAPRDATQLAADARDLWQRVHAEHPPRSVWDVKYAPGGLLAMDFMLQSQALIHTPSALPCQTRQLIPSLCTAGVLSAADATALAQSYNTQLGMMNLLRLCQPDARQAPSAGVQQLMAQTLGLPDAAQLATVLTNASQAAQRILAPYIS